jgi:DNA replication licensing factor MCM7
MEIDEDDFSDEYDFAESDEEAMNARRAARKDASRPRNKYLDILQEIANRERDEITVELDDIAEVCGIFMAKGLADVRLLV